MRINYLLVFIITYLYFYYRLVKNNENFSWNDLECVIRNMIIRPICYSGIVCILCYFLSSSVFEIRDDKKYNRKDYLFYYKDFGGYYHMLVPFTNYLSNETNYKLKIYPIYYGSPKKMIEKELYYKPQEFTSLENTPDYIFREPPSSIRVKNKSSYVKFVLEYN